MRDVDEVKAELHQLAQLPALARRRESLEHLADNLNTEESHLWAKVDIYAAFGPDSIEVPAERELTSRAGWVELARNLLIMTPLLITWMGVSLAVSAYGDMLREDPAAGQLPFIALWEGGFGGRTIATLFRVAVADVMAFTAVILCSLWLSWLRRKIDVSVEAEERGTWNRLREALLEASLHLSQRAFDTPARFNEELTRVMGTLGDVTDRVDEAATRAGEAVGDIERSVHALGTSMVEFNVGAARQELTLAHLGERVDAVASELARLGSRLDDLGNGLSSAASDHQALATSMGSGITELVGAGRALASNSASQTGAVAQFLSEVQAERQRQAELVAAWASATSAASAAAAALSAAGSEIGSSASETRVALVGAAEALDRSSSELSTLAPGLEAANAALGSAARSLPSAIEVANERLRSAGVSLTDQSAVADAATAQAVSALQSTVAAITADMRHASESMTAGVDRLIKVLSNLEMMLSGPDGSRDRR